MGREREERGREGKGKEMEMKGKEKEAKVLPPQPPNAGDATDDTYKRCFLQ